MDLDVQIINNQGTVYGGKVKSVSSVNSRGPFDILAKHENFITLLKSGLKIVDSGGKKHEIPCTNGLLEVSNNRVRVFVGI